MSTSPSVLKNEQNENKAPPQSNNGEPPPSSNPAKAQGEHDELGRSWSETIFPMKLYDILCNPEFHHAISWMPHGRSWKVLNKDFFMEEICPQYFAQTRYESFIRQVNGWGFKRMRREGPDRSTYFHEHFLRGYPHLIDHMRRPAPGEKSRDLREEPDFYAMQAMPQLPASSMAHGAAARVKLTKAGRPPGSNAAIQGARSSFDAVHRGDASYPPPPYAQNSYVMPPGSSWHGAPQWPPGYGYPPPPPGYWGQPPAVPSQSSQWRGPPPQGYYPPMNWGAPPPPGPGGPPPNCPSSMPTPYPYPPGMYDPNQYYSGYPGPSHSSTPQQSKGLDQSASDTSSKEKRDRDDKSDDDDETKDTVNKRQIIHAHDPSYPPIYGSDAAPPPLGQYFYPSPLKTEELLESRETIPSMGLSQDPTPKSYDPEGSE